MSSRKISLVFICMAAFGMHQGAFMHLAEAKGDEDTDKPDSSKTVDVDSLKSGKLIRYGVTLGGALAVYTAVKADNRLSTAAPGFMPYVAIFPFTWAARGKFNRTYCAARFAGEDAMSVANASARAEAKEAKKLSIEQNSDYIKIQENIKALKEKLNSERSTQISKTTDRVSALMNQL